MNQKPPKNPSPATLARRRLEMAFTSHILNPDGTLTLASHDGLVLVTVAVRHGIELLYRVSKRSSRVKRGWLALDDWSALEASALAGAMGTRLRALSIQWPLERLCAEVHAQTGRHGVYCLEACAYPVLVDKPRWIMDDAEPTDSHTFGM